MATRIFEDIIGKTCVAVEGCGQRCDEMVLRFSDGTSAKWYHRQDCCERVLIEDVCGDPADLVGAPLLVAEQCDNIDNPGKPGPYSGSYTWTFYRFATSKGSVTVRWLGESNGYYSESVDYIYTSGKEHWS